MKNMEMKSMEMTPEMKKRMTGDIPKSSAEEGPKYPYGSRLTLEDDHVDMMGMGDAATDDEVEIAGRGKVIGTRAEDRGGKEKSRSVEVQITHMAMSPMKKKPKTEEVLYGGEK